MQGASYATAIAEHFRDRGQHVLLLMDDPMQSVTEPLFDRRDQLTKLYDFPLMMNGMVWSYPPADPCRAFCHDRRGPR